MATQVMINKVQKRTIRVYNESMLEDVVMAAEKAKCKTETADYTTKVIVTGSLDQINNFIKFYNS